MSFDETKQVSYDINGNAQYVDPSYYLFSLEDGYMNLKEIFASYVGEQNKIDAIINEKYMTARTKEPQTVNGSGSILPMPLMNNVLGPVDNGFQSQMDKYKAIYGRPPNGKALAMPPRPRMPPTLRKFSFK